MTWFKRKKCECDYCKTWLFLLNLYDVVFRRHLLKMPDLRACKNCYFSACDTGRAMKYKSGFSLPQSEWFLTLWTCCDLGAMATKVRRHDTRVHPYQRIVTADRGQFSLFKTHSAIDLYCNALFQCLDDALVRNLYCLLCSIIIIIIISSYHHLFLTPYIRTPAKWLTVVCTLLFTLQCFVSID